jgi:hypothetical protein
METIIPLILFALAIGFTLGRRLPERLEYNQLISHMLVHARLTSLRCTLQS